jgi:hypothetical protein
MALVEAQGGDVEFTTSRTLLDEGMWLLIQFLSEAQKFPISNSWGRPCANIRPVCRACT